VMFCACSSDMCGDRVVLGVASAGSDDCRKRQNKRS
jgi:hypothetical protein